MKKTIFIYLIILNTVLAFGQDIKTKKKKDNTREGTATFYVLASNDSIKHGDYQIKAYSGSRILLKGTYNYNKKVGLWTEQYYGRHFKGPKANGYYDNDIKKGEWTYYNFDGEIVLIYNWTESKVIFSKLCGLDSKEQSVFEDGKETKTKLDCLPSCSTGSEYFTYEFNNKIAEHAELFKKDSNGIYQLNTKISITVDKNSSVTDITYSTDENNELKEIIEKFIKSYKWIPGNKDGHNVTSKFEFSINISTQF
jgi:hypothetical protein